MLFRALVLVAALTIPFCVAVSAPLVYTDALNSKAGYLDVKPYKRIGDGRDRSRSPCPFLNTAANHDILPYDGKNIRIELFERLMSKVGVPILLNKLLVSQLNKVAKLNSSKDPNHPTDAIDLADLNPHGLIEHDLSMSRLDVITPTPGDNFASPGLVDKMLDHVFNFNTKNDNAATDAQSNILSVTGIGDWHMERKRIEIDERKHTPANDVKTQFLCAGECFLLLWILGKDGTISGAHAKSFLNDETFPDDWTPNTNVYFTVALAGINKCALAFHTSESILSWFNKPSIFQRQHTAITDSLGSS